MIDAHIHLDQFDAAGLSARIRQWRAAGVTAVVAAGTGAASSQRTLDLARQYPGFVYPCAGYHPESLDPDPDEADRVLAFATAHAPSLVALGEVGLPWYCLGQARDAGALVSAHAGILRRFCRAARRLGKPLVLHAVHDMAARALDILRDEGVPAAMFHWLKAPPPVAAAIWQAGYYISLSPEVVTRARDQDLARGVPLTHLLLESDGPWPHGARLGESGAAGEDGPPGEPTLLAAAAAAVDAARGVHGEAAAATAANARRLFGLGPGA